MQHDPSGPSLEFEHNSFVTSDGGCRIMSLTCETIHASMMAAGEPSMAVTSQCPP